MSPGGERNSFFCWIFETSSDVSSNIVDTAFGHKSWLLLSNAEVMETVYGIFYRSWQVSRDGPLEH